MAPRGSRRGAMAAALAVLIAAAPAGAQTPIAGGGSFNDAPVLEPGAYADTLRGGEQLFYAVEPEAGQRVAATVEIEGRSTTSHFMAVALYTALRAEAGEDTQSFGPQDRRVSLRAESQPAEQPRLHYVSVAARGRGGRGSRAVRHPHRPRGGGRGGDAHLHAEPLGHRDADRRAAGRGRGRPARRRDRPRAGRRVRGRLRRAPGLGR